MATSTLKFGPEWLRNLSDGSVSSAPSSATASSIHGALSHGALSAPKYKLAEFRYGREEMLALFAPPIPIPEELKDVKAILSDRLLQPLALQLETDDEQHLFSQPVNSSAVLRMTGRGSSTSLGLRDVERGRGRGRGRSEGVGFYSRVPIDEENFSRPRHPREGHDSESRGRGFGYTGRSFDDMSASTSSTHGEFSRSMSTDNWRSGSSRKFEDTEGSWRKPSQRPTSRRWREPWEKSSEVDRDRADRRMSEDLCRDRSVPIYRRSTSSNFAYDEESDPLPEWSTDDVDDIGTFDSSGAFMSLKELEQREKKDVKDQDADLLQKEEYDGDIETSDSKDNMVTEAEDDSSAVASAKEDDVSEEADDVAQESSSEIITSVRDTVTMEQDASKLSVAADESVMPSSSDDVVAADEKPADVLFAPGSTDEAITSISNGVSWQEAEVNFDHLELQVENLYASISADEEPPVAAGKEKGFLPPDHEDAKKWFYRDPQGQVQGPFTSGEMAEWFSAGYFNMNLVVKQGADDCFVPLGEMIKKMGSVPFIAPSVKLSPAVGANATELQQHQDQLKLLLIQQQTQALQQQQQQQQQQQIHQQLRNLQAHEALAKLTPAQQQMILQMMVKPQASPQIAATAGQQQKPAKANAVTRLDQLDSMNLNLFQRLSTVSSLSSSSNIPPTFHRSMSQPSGIDVSSLPSSILYGMSTSAAAGSSANLPTATLPTGGNLWRSSNNVPSTSNQNWLLEGGGSAAGLWNVELPKTITAAELEEIQYQALEKAHQQQQQVPALSNLRDSHQLKLQELLGARTGGEKQRDASGLDQWRDLIPQQKQQQPIDIVRLAEEQRRLFDEKRRLLEINPLERQSLMRRDRSEELYRQQQLETLCRLQNDPLVSSIQERDALDVRQLLALQQAQPWAGAHNRGQMASSGASLAAPSSALFHHKDNGTSSSGAASIIQQELLNKHLKSNDVKTAVNPWPLGSGTSGHWAGDANTWGTSLPSKSPLHWDTASAANNKTINTSMPFVPGALSTQAKTDVIMKLTKSKAELTMWCETVLKSMHPSSSMIPNFIRRLMDLTSPAEVNVFVQQCLGDTDDAKKFVKQFVEKQSKLQQQQEALLMQYMSSANQW